MGVFQRLMSLGATQIDLQQSVHTVIVQRLAKVPCECTSQSNNGNVTCFRCFGSGYCGCVAAVEIFQPDIKFFSNTVSWAVEQKQIDKQYSQTLAQLHSNRYIDQSGYSQLISQKGGKDATLSNSSG